MDPYAVLGVDPSASDAEIRDAYRRRSRQLHPDVVGDDATAAMQQLNAAYDALRHRAREPSAIPPPARTRPTAPPRAAVPPLRRSRRRLYVVGVVLLATALVIANANAPAPTPMRSDGTVDLSRLEGECITLDNTGGFEDVVDCTRPHDARVAEVVERGAPCPVYTEAMLPGPRQDLCLDDQ